MADVGSGAPGDGPSTAVDLYWLPLGAGGHSVKWNGRAYETVKARLERREPLALYHSALQVHLEHDTYVIEQTPEPDLSGESRGVVAEGPVGARWAGRFRLFRYEIRVWRGGHIPDVAEAVTVRVASAPKQRLPGGFSTLPGTSQPPSGGATSSRRERCGTPTRSSPGS